MKLPFNQSHGGSQMQMSLFVAFLVVSFSSSTAAAWQNTKVEPVDPSSVSSGSPKTDQSLDEKKSKNKSRNGLSAIVHSAPSAAKIQSGETTKQSQGDQQSDPKMVQELQEIRKMMGGGVAGSLEGIVSEEEAEKLFASGLQEAMSKNQRRPRELPGESRSARPRAQLSGRAPTITWTDRDDLPQPNGYPAWAAGVKSRYIATEKKLDALLDELKVLEAEEKQLQEKSNLVGVELGVIQSRLRGIPDAGFVRPNNKRMTEPELKEQEKKLTDRLREGIVELANIRRRKQLVKTDIQEQRRLLSLYKGAMETAKDRWETPGRASGETEPEVLIPAGGADPRLRNTGVDLLPGEASAAEGQSDKQGQPDKRGQPDPERRRVVSDRGRLTRRPTRSGSVSAKIATLRDSARKLEEVAAELEELELYEQADEVRAQATKLRLKARSFR